MAEIAHETVYYNTVSKALAERFVKAVEDAVALASQFPAMNWPPESGRHEVC